MGRFKGRVEWCKPARTAVQAGYEFVSEGVLLNAKLRAVSRLRQLHFLLGKGINVVECSNLWDKLLRAKAFKPSFADWLLCNEMVSFVPQETPTLDWMDSLMPHVEHEVVHWKRVVAADQARLTNKRFAADWTSGGSLHAKCVKDPSPAPLDALLQTTRLGIQPLRCNKGHLARFRVTEPHLVHVGATWCFGKRTVRVKKVDGDVVTTTQPMHVEMFKKAVQQKMWCTNPAFLYDELKSFWSGYWNTGNRVNLSDIQSLVQGLPQLDPFDPTVSAKDVRTAIRGLKPGKARGLDGFSNVELQCFSADECALLAEMFNAIVDTGHWPEELCAGVVSLLAKVPEPAVAKDGRPITILPTLYRLFGKIFTQKIFAHWGGILPDSLFGSVPGKCSADAAWELASCIEESLAENSDLFGVSLDLSKAYNTIQRNALQAFAVRCGWPAKLASAYVGYLDRLQRFFRIQDGVYGPVCSTVGIPEGCPLAVPSMILITWAVTQQTSLHGCCLTSYVDNWTIQSTTAEQIPRALQAISQATDSLHLLLNPEKTRAYATTPSGRNCLKAILFQGFPLEVSLKVGDLGVDFNVSRQQTTAAFEQRVEDNKTKFQRLQVMPWSAERKAEVLTRTLQPAILFGCELAAISQTSFKNLRGQFSGAVWGKTNRRNHFLSPLLGCSVVYEPFVEVLKRRVSALQRAVASSQDATSRRWNAVLRSSSRVTGPFSYLFQQLQALGWVPLPGLICLDRQGCKVDLALTSKKHFRQLVLDDWWRTIADKLPDQPGLLQVECVDVSHTIQLRKRCKFKGSVLGCFTTGAAVFSNQKKHFLPEAACKCKHCGSEDSQMHRLRDCPFYEYARTHLPAGFFEVVSEPELLRGLFSLPVAVKDCQQWLMQQPSPSLSPFFDEPIAFFTDGSTEPHAVQAKCAWAVVIAETDSYNNAIFEHGILPGFQCNYRAELFAVLVTVKSGCGGVIYCDNQAVVCGLRVLSLQGWVHSKWLTCAATELWWDVWVAFAPNRGRWEFCHVKSHSNWSVLPEGFQRWCAFHNDAADEAAKKARSKWPVEGSELIASARAAADAQLLLASQVFQLHQQVLTGKKTSHHEHSAGEVTAPAREPQSSQPLDLAAALSFDVVWPSLDMSNALMNPRFMTVLYEFLQHEDLVRAPVWIPLLEVYLFFVLKTGWVTPVNVATFQSGLLPAALRDCRTPSAWAHEVDYEALRLCRPTLGSQMRTFLHALKEVSRRASLDLTIQRESSLKSLNISELVPSVRIVPKEIRRVRQQLCRILDGHTYARAMRCPFGPSSPAVPCHVPVVHPTVVWNAYMRSKRAQRIN